MTPPYPRFFNLNSTIKSSSLPYSGHGANIGMKLLSNTKPFLARIALRNFALPLLSLALFGRLVGWDDGRMDGRASARSESERHLCRVCRSAPPPPPSTPTHARPRRVRPSARPTARHLGAAVKRWKSPACLPASATYSTFIKGTACKSQS